MGNIVSKVLQDQYLKLCSLKVDEDKQDQLLQQILTNLRRTEKKLLSELTPSPERLPFYKQRVLEGCSDDSNRDLIEDINLISEYPRIKLAADTIDYAFQQISNNPKIPDLLKLIIMSLKPSLFRLALQDYRILVSESNPILHTIDILISYVPLWKDEKKANYPTFRKLVSLLDFVDTTSVLLNKKLEDTVYPIAQIRENQQKRSLIFEKRLVEREASAAITRTSQLFIEEILTQIKQRYTLEEFLSDFLELHWSRLLTLEFVRLDQAAFIDALKLFIRLINSLTGVSSKQELNHLIDELPELKQGLLAGLTKLAVSELEANEFLTEIELIHLNIIQKNSQLSTAEDLADATNEDGDTPSTTEEHPSPSIDEDDLIRLKPTDFYATENSADSPIADQGEASGVKIEHDASSDEATCKDIEDPLASKNFLEAIEDNIQLDNSKKNIQTTNQELFAKMHKELSQLVFPAHTTYDSEEIKNYISLNNWYSIKDDQQLHKLIYIDENTEQHIFANQMAQKSYTYKMEEINQLYNQQQINKFEAPNIVAPAIKKSLQIYRDFLTERKARNKQEPAEIIDILQQDPTKLSELENQSEKSRIESTPLDDYSSEKIISTNISDITVGSWINYDLNKRQIKCKLAARIVSKDIYIFVDRKGLKILEQSTEELTEKLHCGKIKIIESENSGRLESVIAKTRNLKS